MRLQADPRLKQNQEDLQLLAHVQGQYLFLKEHGLILNQEPSGKKNKHGATEFWRLKDFFQNKFEYSQYWSDDVWKSKMAGGGGTRKDFNVVLTRQDNKFFTFELFKAIQDAIPLILHCRTMC